MSTSSRIKFEIRIPKSEIPAIHHRGAEYAEKSLRERIFHQRGTKLRISCFEILLRAFASQSVIPGTRKSRRGGWGRSPTFGRTFGDFTTEAQSTQSSEKKFFTAEAPSSQSSDKRTKRRDFTTEDAEIGMRVGATGWSPSANENGPAGARQTGPFFCGSILAVEPMWRIFQSRISSRVSLLSGSDRPERRGVEERFLPLVEMTSYPRSDPVLDLVPRLP